MRLHESEIQIVFKLQSGLNIIFCDLYLIVRTLHNIILNKSILLYLNRVLVHFVVQNLEYPGEFALLV